MTERNSLIKQIIGLNYRIDPANPELLFSLYERGLRASALCPEGNVCSRMLAIKSIKNGLPCTSFRYGINNLSAMQKAGDHDTYRIIEIMNMLEINIFIGAQSHYERVFPNLTANIRNLYYASSYDEAVNEIKKIY